MDTGLEAIGTNAHELPMVYAALADDDEAMRQAPYEVLRDWARMYGGNLLIVLPDCFGIDRLPRARARLGRGLEGRAPGFEGAARRPRAGTDRLVAAARAAIRTEKLIVLSDGMDIDTIEAARQGAARPHSTSRSAGAPTSPTTSRAARPMAQTAS